MGNVALHEKPFKSGLPPYRCTVVGGVAPVKGVGKYLLACGNVGVNLPGKLCSDSSEEPFSLILQIPGCAIFYLCPSLINI